MGDCLVIPGYPPDSPQGCRDNSTGSVVPCSSPVCGQPTSAASGAAGGGCPVGYVPATSETCQLAPLPGYGNPEQHFEYALPGSPEGTGINHWVWTGSNFIWRGPLPPPPADRMPSPLNVASASGMLPGFVPMSGTGDTRAGAAAAGGPRSNGYPVGVTLENLTSGQSSSFNVGDQWRLTISGPPGQPVAGAAQQSGRNLGVSNYGSTDSSGHLVLTGTMTADTVGSWSEQWTVGGRPVGSVSFVVVAPSQKAATGGTQSTQQQQQQSTPSTGDWFSSSFDLFGFQVPMWAALLAGGGVVWWLSSSGSGGRRYGG